MAAKKVSLFNGDTFGEFFSCLLQHTEGEVFLVLDNARWHRAQNADQFLFENRDRLVRFFTAVLCGTQCDRKDVQNHPEEGNPQSPFRNDKRY